ncbi:Uncharacterised protein [Mycobacteroides abscessus subsp. abscessus]|nr:Uncharacterised protein [Mycobacteroides abscessus subsp. abscessus]
MGLHEVDHLLVDPGEGRLGVDGLGVLELAVGAVHLAAGPNHGRHRGVDDHVAGRVEVRNTLGRVHHGQLRPVLVTGVQVADDLLVLRRGQGLDLAVQVRQSIVDVDAQLVEQLLVLFEGVLVEDLDRVAEDDGVADPHHGRLDVQGQHHTGLVGVFDLLLVEVAERLLTHEHAVDDVALAQLDLGLEHDGVTALGGQHHLHRAVAIQRQRLLSVVEIALLHGGDMRARGLRPLAHAVRVLAGVLLHRLRGATVRVAFTQNGIHRTTETLGVPRLDLSFFFVLGVPRVLGQLVALAL